jgi:hypothetical protein
MTEKEPLPEDQAGPAAAAPVYATAADLFAAAAVDDGEDLVLSTGMTVRIKSISRKANLELGKGEPGVAVMEARLIHAGLVEPKMSVAAILELQERGDTKLLGEISNAIRELSGMGQGADKSSV